MNEFCLPDNFALFFPFWMDVGIFKYYIYKFNMTEININTS